MTIVEFYDQFISKGDGTYLFTPAGVVDYAERWSYGYIVGVRPLEMNDLKTYTLAGIWTDENGMRHYDLVKHVDAYQDAVRMAHDNEQVAIYDMRDEKVVMV
jgi:hypothetical protein